MGGSGEPEAQSTLTEPRLQARASSLRAAVLTLATAGVLALGFAVSTAVAQTAPPADPPPTTGPRPDPAPPPPPPPAPKPQPKPQPPPPAPAPPPPAPAPPAASVQPPAPAPAPRRTQPKPKPKRATARKPQRTKPARKKAGRKVTSKKTPTPFVDQGIPPANPQPPARLPTPERSSGSGQLTSSPIVRSLVTGAAAVALFAMLLAALPLGALERLLSAETHWRTEQVVVFVDGHRLDIVVAGVATLLVAVVVALPTVTG